MIFFNINKYAWNVSTLDIMEINTMRAALFIFLSAYSTIYGVYVYRSSKGGFKFIFKVIVPPFSMCMCVKFIDVFKYECIWVCMILKRLICIGILPRIEDLRTPWVI